MNYSLCVKVQLYFKNPIYILGIDVAWLFMEVMINGCSVSLKQYIYVNSYMSQLIHWSSIKNELVYPKHLKITKKKKKSKTKQINI